MWPLLVYIALSPLYVAIIVFGWPCHPRPTTPLRHVPKLPIATFWTDCV
jgi:hypothetical protein